MRPLLNNFFRGLLLVFPIGATVYIIYSAVVWSNNVLNDLLFEWLSVDIPGLGMITVFLSISLIGYIFSLTFTRPLVTYFEQLLKQVPIIKIIYTALKDLTEAFVGDKKRFNKPVIVDFGNTQVKRMGFVTEDDLKELDITGMVAVYCPHSYNFSGNLYFVPADSVQPLNLDSTDAMKYIVSGGITSVETDAES
ncbi:DUF502 domain-containing protein [Fodinibius salsisoli]|uniref:DUF502 domain-containing protein n=1 Tax=Fodinibius salsisoli TaxID=2820877 RepID=A0ABT3PJ07_9BACT|nr:DUF502 domain-containing protein [Fodinibius salsisoli]MCW9705911.1 DUF502 domain-containing protein [Fodinibius salsisoli]